MSHIKICITITIIMLPIAISGDLNIISRAQWGARPANSSNPLREIPPPFVVVHHSDGAQCLTEESCKARVRGIQSYHMDSRKWQDIGYNFLIGSDGNVYEGRGWGIFGAHVPLYNGRSIGICLIGSYMTVEPPLLQLQVLESLIEYSVTNNYTQPNYHLIGHRQGRKTNCPGDRLFSIIKTWPHFDKDIAVQ